MSLILPFMSELQEENKRKKPKKKDPNYFDLSLRDKVPIIERK